jgi:hypothetical protein
MNEETWLAATDPQAMLAFLRESGKGSERKFRLFAGACCRRMWHLLTDERSRYAVDVAERYADGCANKRELKVARRAAEAAAVGDRSWLAIQLVRMTNEDWDPDPYDCRLGAAAKVASAHIGAKLREIADAACDLDCNHQFQPPLLRDIFGLLPFRPPIPLPPHVLAWSDGILVGMANAVYDERALPAGTLDVTRLGVLADALEDAGCTDPDLLRHLREDGAHVRGCWALDRVLGKE